MCRWGLNGRTFSPKSLQARKGHHHHHCPSSTSAQTREHLLQSCPTFSILRCQTWPSVVGLDRERWGTVAALRWILCCRRTCLPLRLYRICSRKSSKSIGRSGNMDSLSKVPDSLIHEKQKQIPKQTVFSIFPKSSRSFCAGT